MRELTPYLIATLWCGAHLLAFRLHRRRLRREISIFLFHVGAFVIFGAAVVATSLAGRLSAASMLGLMSLHGLYSLTFLWLWSATEGSYSLAILRTIAAGQGRPAALVETFARLGADKRKARLCSLQRLKLIRRTGGVYTLTASGYMAAKGIRILRRIANCHEASG